MSRTSIPRIHIQIKHELLALLGLSFLLVVTIYVIPISALRIILAIAYVLYFPGYTLVAALFPGNDDLEGIERLTLSFVLSMALVSLIALGLNWTPWGVRLETILVAVTSFIVLACGVAYYRRGKLPSEKRFVVRLELALPKWPTIAWSDKVLGAVLVLSVLFAGGTVLYFLINPKVRERYTEFYLLGPSGKLDEYPTEIVVDDPITLIVGVVNREHEDVEYRLDRDIDGQGMEQVAQIRLAHEEKWEEALTFALLEPGEDRRVSFVLYKEGQDEAYRSLHLWITVLPSGVELASPTPSPTGPPTLVPTSTPAISTVTTPTLTPSPTPSPTGTATATPQGRTLHIVQSGETLWRIARQYGVSMEAIIYVNRLEDPRLLEVGQELIIPGPDEILPTLTPTRS